MKNKAPNEPNSFDQPNLDHLVPRTSIDKAPADSSGCGRINAVDLANCPNNLNTKEQPLNDMDADHLLPRKK